MQKINTMFDLERHAQKVGSPFFSPDNMRFFKSRTYEALNLGDTDRALLKGSADRQLVQFVTSEKQSGFRFDADREYRVRLAVCAPDDLQIETIAIVDSLQKAYTRLNWTPDRWLKDHLLYHTLFWFREEHDMSKEEEGRGSAGYTWREKERYVRQKGFPEFCDRLMMTSPDSFVRLFESLEESERSAYTNYNKAINEIGYCIAIAGIGGHGIELKKDRVKEWLGLWGEDVEAIESAIFDVKILT